jgi:hypothetical protein
MTAISPYHYNTDFPNGLSFDQKVDVYVARVQGWQLEPAQRLIDIDGHSGFAVLHILASYFESFAQFHKGASSKNKSREFFKFGFNDVFPILDQTISASRINKILDQFYDGIRCGLYHNGLTHANIYLSGDLEHPVAVIEGKVIALNPHSFPRILHLHLHHYASKLRNPSPEYDDLRKCFEATFDAFSNGKEPRKKDAK